jgi:hypothetical protein
MCKALGLISNTEGRRRKGGREEGREGGIFRNKRVTCWKKVEKKLYIHTYKCIYISVSTSLLKKYGYMHIEQK